MLKTRIKEEMVAAMKAGDKRRLGVIRLLLAAIKQREVDETIELDDTQVLVVLDKMVKQRGLDRPVKRKRAGRILQNRSRLKSPCFMITCRQH